MLLSDEKPMHCQNVLNQMKENYKTSTIYQTRITLYSMFADAVENDIILRNPVTKAVKYNIGKEPKKVRALSIEEQRKFLEVAKNSSNYNQYAFILQTGLRTGELIGLKWSDIDFDKRVIHIQRSMEYRYSIGEWRIGEPKSKSGYRDVPLTDEAIAILKNQKEKLKTIKIINMQFSEFILGHSNVGITMNLYVHVTEEEKVKEVERIQSALKIV